MHNIAKNNLPGDEYNLFSKVYDIISSYLPKPDLIIYLYNNSESLLKNIAKRGRDYEKEISANYLINIQDSYINYLKHYNHIPILIVESHNLDFVEHGDDYLKIRNLIESQYSPGINRITF